MLLKHGFKTNTFELTAGAFIYIAHKRLVYRAILLIGKYSKQVANFFKYVFPVYFNLLKIISEIRQIKVFVFKLRVFAAIFCCIF